MQKTLVKFITALCAVFMFAGCAKAELPPAESGTVDTPVETEAAEPVATEQTVAKINQPADMSGYETYDPNTEYVFDSANAVDILVRMENKETFVAYFGFANCPYCNPAMPVLNEVASQNDFRIDYIDVRSDEAWKSNLDIDGYDLLVEKIGYLFEKDDNGLPHMYVPFVIFVKDGDVVLDHTGVTDDYDAGSEMTTEQKAELTEIYAKGFSLIR